MKTINNFFIDKVRKEALKTYAIFNNFDIFIK